MSTQDHRPGRDPDAAPGAPAPGAPQRGPRRRGDQWAVPAMVFRGGTSRGPFFRAEDLPQDPAARDRVLLAALGSPHRLQVDGIGGGHPLTSKVGIVAASPNEAADLDFTFAQLQPEGTAVQTRANCGNMLAAVLPFAVETGLVRPQGETTSAVVRTTNTGLLARITVHTPEVDGVRTVTYAGTAQEQEGEDAAPQAGGSDGAERVPAVEIAGVPGTAAPVHIRFLDTAGSVASSLLPTGHEADRLHLPDGAEVAATLIDNGQPMVVLRAEDLGRTGRESPAELNADDSLKEALEALRREAGELMGLGDVGALSYPKMALVAAPEAEDAALAVRCFIPRVAHEAIGVLAAVTLATAACLPGSVAADLARPGEGRSRRLGIEHPSGTFAVDLELDASGTVIGSGITRTARLLMEGSILVPASAAPTGAAALGADPAPHRKDTP